MGRFAIIAILSVAVGGKVGVAGEPQAHWERTTLDAGADLHTLFAEQPTPEPGVERERVPIVSILRDTLGDNDPANDRLRYVWLLTGSKRQWAARDPSLGRMPRPLVDLASPGKDVWKAVLRRTVQAALLDSNGPGLRISSRGYWSGRRASRAVRLYEALAVMQETPPDALESDEQTEALARMMLTGSMLGGLVPPENLERILERRSGRRRRALGRNWELLRQRAEAEGLVFQPIGMDGEQPTGALLWISREDLHEHWGRPFRSKFLAVADPWRDRTLLEWRGYTESWCFDADGRRTTEESASGGCEQMIPLGLYGLDHPKSPLLLIDFRSAWKPALRKTARRTMDELPRTVLGLNPLTNLELRAMRLIVNSVRGRWGAPVQRRHRLRAGAAVRRAALASPRLAPEMRELLAERLGLDGSLSVQRYEALLAWARSSDGLEKRIEKDRARELALRMHPGKARWFGVLTVATAGLYRYRKSLSPERLALLDRERRLETAADQLETALAAGPRVDVGCDLDEVRKAVSELAGADSVTPSMRKRCERLLRELVQQPVADEIHRELVALIHASDEAAPPSKTLAAGGMD